MRKLRILQLIYKKEINMKKYNKPLFEEIIITSKDVILSSGIEVNNTNAGFNNPDETL
jgi:hypothetical protein